MSASKQLVSVCRTMAPGRFRYLVGDLSPVAVADSAEGWDGVRGAVSHAKFCALEAADGRTLGIVTSANLNRNCRSESYLISSDPAFGRMLLDCCASLERFGAKYGRNAGYYDNAAESAFGVCAVARSGESLADMVRRLGA